MNNFFIDLNRFYNKNKIIIWTIIIVIILFLLVMREIDKLTNKTGDSDNTNVTISENNENTDTIYNVINSISSNEITTNNIQENTLNNDIAKIKDSITSDEEAIAAFILLCNNKKVDLAYEMLSDNCKQVLYPTKQNFVNDYYSAIFKTYKNYQVISFKNNTYKVSYKEDELTTGNIENTNIVDYITVIDNYELNISGYIASEEMDNEAQNSYVSVKILNKDIYLDYEIYTVEVENLTYANIYINDLTDSNMFITNSNGSKFYLANNEYNDGDLLINSSSKKEIKLKFYRTYQNDNDIASMDFENIKLINRNYYGQAENETNSTNENSEYIIYDRNFTNYPETVKLKITL